MTITLFEPEQAIRSDLGEQITREALSRENPPVLNANRIDGVYSHVAEYIGVQYDLLLEDFMHSLRETFKDFKKTPNASSFKGARIYRSIRLQEVVESVNRNPRITYRLSDLSFRNEEEEDALPSFGQLLLFTKTDFKNDLLLGKVVSDWKKTGNVEVELVRLKDARTKPSGRYTVLQAKPFFYKYDHILRALDTFNEDNFPMKEYIVYGSKDRKYPAYLRQSTVYNIGSHVIPVVGTRKWLLDESLEMDKSQLSALETALTRKLAVIQGPPGTGKTHFAVRMVKVLVDNAHAWNPKNRTPLLVVCQSNQALDHFLEGLLKHTKNIVRVGEQSESDKLQPFLLKKLISDRLSSWRGGRVAAAREWVLQNTLVVGLTTTGASARREILDLLRSPIVIVEEAAEVLEADVVASMTEHCQHLILLGDHKQLKPIVTTHHLGTDYNLNMSLFERLIRNEMVKVSCLTTQYRMRPEISCLLKPHFYTKLDDGPSTLNRPPVTGLTKSVFFLHHEQEENTVSGKTGFFNAHEVEMLIRLANYFVTVGYKSSQVTIIAMYAEQRNKLIEARKKYRALEDIEVASVDSFQGKENDIILLSLVRNNGKRQIGFLKEETRICVALSRAKIGLFIMGNERCLSNANIRVPTVWKEVLRRLKEQDAVGTRLTLHCRKHDARCSVSRPEDWNDDFCRGWYEDRLLQEKSKEARRRQAEEAARQLREQQLREERQRQQAESIRRQRLEYVATWQQQEQRMRAQECLWREQRSGFHPLRIFSVIGRYIHSFWEYITCKM